MKLTPTKGNLFTVNREGKKVPIKRQEVLVDLVRILLTDPQLPGDYQSVVDTVDAAYSDSKFDKSHYQWYRTRFARKEGLLLSKPFNPRSKYSPNGGKPKKVETGIKTRKKKKSNDDTENYHVKLGRLVED